MLTLEPPHGICAWPKGDRANVIAAQIRGPEGTPFEGGTWDLTVVVPDRYPFEPPKVQFDTPIYHLYRQWRADLPGYTKDATERFVATVS